MHTISRVLATRALLAGAFAAGALASAGARAAPTVPDARFPAVEWRLVGPYRGGWSTMAVGVPGRPETFYFGAAGGGVWKSTDAGRTWGPVSDGQPITAVGALAVAPSNPDVLYVGTGHPEPRYDVGAGTGVYRSSDAGRTWHPAGLERTKHVGDIVIDPRDPDTVVVAAQGALFGPSEDRGVYRSSDGGRTWTRTLYVDAQTGAVDLAQDPADPDVLYASTWTARVWPWLSYFTPVEGEGSAVWRSGDGGRSWTKLGGEGWPAGALGRIGLAVAHAHGATRLYASISKSGPGSGLYRSDDGGGHWRKVNDVRWLTSWYMSRLTVSPVDPDTVYTVGQSIHRSRDGGATFETIRGAPGGDDFHYLWIDPRDPERMIAASDQGTIVTVNGGATWSEWYNQPTGQFYYLATDDRFPYWIYSGQQDSGTVRIASRSDYGSISLRDWEPVGGEERDYDLPDADDPNVVYGSGLGGAISRWDARTGEVQNVSPWPLSSYGRRPTDFRYHYHWFTPLAFSRATPKGKAHAFYAGSQVLFRSYDGGQHWSVISPDLSGAHDRTGPPAPECGGSPTVEQAWHCGYGVINTIAPSPRDDAEIWIGTDDGRVWLTQDGGAHWRDATPPGVPRWAKISSIDPSPLAAGGAYVAVDNHRQDDFAPRAFRTADHGAHWTDITSDLPPGHYVSVVRADPVRAGLLYAGTELGVHVSFDDGGHWQSLQRNLPPAWAHDLLVKDRDLIVATNGRAIWVLDDLTPLRQVAAEAPPAPAVLYRPSPAFRVRSNRNRDTPFTQETALGRNPPVGAVIDYWLAAPARGPVAIEVRDAAGALVRRVASDDPANELDAERYFDERWTKPAPRPSAQAGAHRFVWNLRYARPRAIEYHYTLSASFAEGTAIAPDGPLVAPGEYRVSLLVDERRFEAPLTVVADPRVTAPAADVAAGIEFSRALDGDLDRAWRGYAEVVAVREQVAARRGALGTGGGAAGDSARAALDRLDARLAALLVTDVEAADSFAQQGGVLGELATDVADADRAPTAAQLDLARATRDHLARAEAAWAAVRRDELAAASKALVRARAAKLNVPDAAHLGGPEAPESQDLP